MFLYGIGLVIIVLSFILYLIKEKYNTFGWIVSQKIIESLTCYVEFFANGFNKTLFEEIKNIGKKPALNDHINSYVDEYKKIVECKDCKREQKTITYKFTNTVKKTDIKDYTEEDKKITSQFIDQIENSLKDEKKKKEGEKVEKVKKVEKKEDKEEKKEDKKEEKKSEKVEKKPKKTTPKKK